MSNSFQKTFDHIRSIADSEAHKGRLFERLMKTYFVEDPLYKERFSHVWLWSEWSALKPGFDGADTGIDLVAEEREGGYCAIQCKCYAPGTRISNPHLDLFIAVSARAPFTARVVVDTGDGWWPNAVKTIVRLAGSGPRRTGGADVEQRNGRIDRKLQPADEVRCHYFVLPQRIEDRVLEVLVRKTETIKKELGSLSKVIDGDIERILKAGICHRDVDELVRELETADLDEERKRISEEELESARERQEDLKKQISTCQSLLEKSREWVGFQSGRFRDALSCSLELMGAEPLRESRDDDGHRVWTFPLLGQRTNAEANWAAILDTLRVPRKTDQKLTDWRREAPIRPIVFEDAGVLSEDTVHLHLEQRVAQRLLAIFRSQGFILHDLSRACLAQVADSIPRIILLGRLSLYGQRAECLHEEIVPLAARWVEPTLRTRTLKAYAREAELKTLDLLDQSLSPGRERVPGSTIQQKLLDAAPRDIEELLPQLEPRALELARIAVQRLHHRGAREEKDLRETLERQRKRVIEELEKHDRHFHQLTFNFGEEEKRQLESNMKAWRIRLKQFEVDLEQEPTRIRKYYEVRAQRIEPVGLVYLWPETN